MIGRNVLTFTVSWAIFQCFVWSHPAAAQNSNRIDIRPPEFGTLEQARPIDGMSETPLPDGFSFDALRALMAQLSARDQYPMRGAREIAIFRQAAPAVVLIKTETAFGTGVVLPNGMILTNRHVVEGVHVVQIILKPDDLVGGKEAIDIRVGRVRQVDPTRDLAIIAPDSLPRGHKSLKIASRDDVEVGADVYAIGHPLGYAWTFTQGIVSGLRRINSEGQSYTAIQTQTPINSGNSGGPLLNAELEVVGINTWVRDISDIDEKQIAGEKVRVARPAQGLNFAVSARDVRAFLDEVASGKISNLALQLPSIRDCSIKVRASGRSKANDAAMDSFSLRCDDKADAWLVVPDDKSKPRQFMLDPDRTGKIAIIVFADLKTGKWQKSYWDFFRDQTYAVIGHHEDGGIKPTRFEFTKS
jgi:S1-C subfamily serine protease